MLIWALIFAAVAVTAGVFSFTGISAGAAKGARFLFLLLVVVFAVFLLMHPFHTAP